ncbi:chromo domain-containing protein rhino isoform X1 [Drosophila bipectinata]|uniref:chromo domain-containing protein rhino isoform X1 n=1 Tax=Drosophila bipectinata TaxID=42026 RepID=UPI0038B3C165
MSEAPESSNNPSETWEFVVEKICGKRFTHGRPELLVKWLGYTEQDNSWEPLENLGNCIEMVCDFEAELFQKTKGRNKNETKLQPRDILCVSPNTAIATGSKIVDDNTQQNVPTPPTTLKRKIEPFKRRRDSVAIGVSSQPVISKSQPLEIATGSKIVDDNTQKNVPTPPTTLKRKIEPFKRRRDSVAIGVSNQPVPKQSISKSQPLDNPRAEATIQNHSHVKFVKVLNLSDPSDDEDVEPRPQMLPQPVSAINPLPEFPGMPSSSGLDPESRSFLSPDETFQSSSAPSLAPVTASTPLPPSKLCVDGLDALKAKANIWAKTNKEMKYEGFREAGIFKNANITNESLPIEPRPSSLLLGNNPIGSTLTQLLQEQMHGEQSSNVTQSMPRRLSLIRPEMTPESPGTQGNNTINKPRRMTYGPGSSKDIVDASVPATPTISSSRPKLTSGSSASSRISSGRPAWKLPLCKKDRVYGLERGLPLEKVVHSYRLKDKIFLFIKWQDCSAIDAVLLDEVKEVFPLQVIEYFESLKLQYDALE